jgi:hypothetical protein
MLGNDCTVLLAAPSNVVGFGSFVGRAAQDGFIVVVVPNELETDCTDRALRDRGANHHADPVAMSAAAMSSVNRETAEAGVD